MRMVKPFCAALLSVLVFSAGTIAAAVAAYALSPIDLIPDFIPILGYLDDLIIVPAGIMLAVRLVPADLMAEFRAEASQRQRPASKVGAAVIIAMWLAALLAIGWWIRAPQQKN